MKAYFALKVDRRFARCAAYGARAQAILAAGGAERANVFTRIQLALFGDVPWARLPGDADRGGADAATGSPSPCARFRYWSRTVMCRCCS